MKSPRQYKWRASFATVIEDNVQFIVAPSLNKALGVLVSHYGRKFIDQFLLEIKFHSVL